MTDIKQNSIIENSSLYDGSLLTQIDWNSRKANFKNGISPKNIGEALVMRPLEVNDFERGYMDLLGQLTNVGTVQMETFQEKFHAMKACSNSYFVTVIEDTSINKVIATATLITEHKFIHSAGKRGRVEDVVVNTDYRGKQLGKLLVETMTLMGKSLGVYKMSLECTEDNLPFYESFGYSLDGQLFMVQRFKE